MTDVWDAEDRRLLAAGELEELLARYVRAIDLRCCAKVRDAADAGDVAQAVLFRLWKELKAGKGYAVPFRVVVHQVVGWTVKAHFAAQAGDALPAEWDAVDPADPYAGVEERLTLERLFEGLTEKERLIFERRYLKGAEIAEIAAELAMQRNAVDQALYRGHAKLRGLIDA